MSKPKSKKGRTPVARPTAIGAHGTGQTITIDPGEAGQKIVTPVSRAVAILRVGGLVHAWYPEPDATNEATIVSMHPNGCRIRFDRKARNGVVSGEEVFVPWASLDINLARYAIELELVPAAVEKAG